jgi:hypothetical protein
MRRWLIVMAAALMAASPVAGYAQTPSGDKMKDDKAMEKMDKTDKKGGKMMDKKGDKMMKGKMMDKKDDKMEKMDKMDKK